MDPRVRELHIERSQHSALPLPANVSFADVIGNDIDVFHNDNDTHKEGTHAFFIKLGDKTALALGFEKQYDRGPSEIRYKGQLVKLGPLLRSPPDAAHSMMWVWEAELPPGAVPLVRERLPLPLILYKDEMTILTAEGPKQAVLTNLHPGGPIMPGHAISDGAMLTLEEAESYTAIRVGDPVIQTSTGIVVAAVRSKSPWTASMKEPADCGIVWLAFPRPPEKLSAPLEQVWGAAVPSNPSVDDAFLQKFLPARALGTKIGETIEEAWERNPLLHRLPPEAKSRWFSADYFGEEWVFSHQNIATKDGRVVRIDYETACSIGSKSTMLYVNWLAEKFQTPKEVRKSARGRDLLAIWNQGPIWVAAIFSLSDKTISVDMFVAGGETELKDRFNQDSFSVPAGASDKDTFLKLASELASQATEEDFGVTEKLPLQNLVMAASPSKAVMKRNGQDIQLGAPTQPVSAQRAEIAREVAPAAQPMPSRSSDYIRKIAVQRVEHVCQAAQAFNALPIKMRKSMQNQTSSGAFALLVDHADKHPDLVLNDELYHTMKWTLQYTTKAELMETPALEKLVRVINAEIVLASAWRTAQQAASVFEAAKTTGTTELDDVKTAEEAIQRLNKGVNGSGAFKDQRFISKSTPELATEACKHLQYDAQTKTLRYAPKSVKVEGSDVPMEGLKELAMLVNPETTPWPNPKAPIQFAASDTDPLRTARSLSAVFATVKATGSTELDSVKTVEEAIQRLNKGVNGSGAFAGKVFVAKTTPEQAAAARRHLTMDLIQHTLTLTPDGMSQSEYNLKLRANQTSQAPQSTVAVTAHEAQQVARRLVAVFDAAVAIGSKDIDQLQTLDQVVERLTTDGLVGAGAFEGKRIYTRAKPGESEAAKTYLKFDSFTKTLSFSSGASRPSMSGNETRPNVMNVSREVRQSPPSEISATQAERKAIDLAATYETATAGSTSNFADAHTLEDVIQLLNAGVEGAGVFAGRRFYFKTTPAETAAVRPYLKFDALTKTLRFTPQTTSDIPRSAPTQKDMEESRAAAAVAKSRRSAQTLCSVFNAAVASGASELEDVKTVDRAVELMLTGVNGGGPFKNNRFVVDSTPEEAEAAKPYLEFRQEDQMLIYKHSDR